MSTFTYRPVPLTKRLHAQVYDSILPSNPSLSQAGNTVLITGGSDGIGFAIAKYFGLAKADKVIITGRTSEKLDIAVQKLTQDHMDTSDSCTTTIKFEGRVCQLSDSDSINNLFHGLSVQGIHVGVLVLNAAVNVAGTLSDQGYERTWEQFIYCIINVSTGAIHDFGSPRDLSSYSLTKAAGTMLMQKLADETNPSKTQIISFHPGAVLTAQARDKGMTENMMNWDDVSLPGAFAVWCASHNASFLHGRFVWAAWDVDELGNGVITEKLENDSAFLRIGVHGI